MAKKKKKKKHPPTNKTASEKSSQILAHIKQEPLQSSPSPGPTTVKKPFYKRAYVIITAIVTILGLPTAYFTFEPITHKAVTSKEDLWKEGNYISGVNIPMDLSDNKRFVHIITGGLDQGIQFTIGELKNGINYKDHIPLFILPGGCTPFNLEFKLINSHLFVSTTFKDINDKWVGKMAFNHWEAKNDKIAYFHDFHPGGDNMELMDDENHVLFNMIYRYPNIIEINGYFNTDSCIMVADRENQIFTGFAKGVPGLNFKEEALRLISRIKPLNIY